MNFETYQECRTTEGWQPVRVLSSDGEHFYVVLANPWGRYEEYICECKGYDFRGSCRHQVEAEHMLCRWSERDHEIQTTPQKEARICPRCGGPTRYVMEVANGE